MFSSYQWFPSMAEKSFFNLTNFPQWCCGCDHRRRHVSICWVTCVGMCRLWVSYDGCGVLMVGTLTLAVSAHWKIILPPLASYTFVLWTSQAHIRDLRVRKKLKWIATRKTDKKNTNKTNTMGQTQSSGDLKTPLLVLPGSLGVCWLNLAINWLQ